jgi:hypothetical protein
MDVVDLLSDDDSFASVEGNGTSKANDRLPLRDAIGGQKGRADGGDSGENNSELITRKKILTDGMVIEVDCSPDKPSKNRLRSKKIMKNPYKKFRNPNKKEKRTTQLKDTSCKRDLQAGLVFEEDVYHNNQHGRASPRLKSFENDYDLSGDEETKRRRLTNPPSSSIYSHLQLTTRIAHQLPPILYHDLDFVAGSPATIGGSSFSKDGKSIAPPKCRCRPPRPCKLAYSSKDGPNQGRPYHCCRENRGDGCKFFSWAFASHTLHWYRFGNHNGHILVNPNRGFRADDLVQGIVGDCWFLSALAVVAERSDLIGRLIGTSPFTDGSCCKQTSLMHPRTCDNFGAVEVTLFVDGFWKTIIMDNFLPCLVDLQSEKDEDDSIQMALELSLENSEMDPKWLSDSNKRQCKHQVSSKFDPHAMADECRKTLHEIHEFLHQDRISKDPFYRSNSRPAFLDYSSRPLHRNVATSDLAYSKARHNQLWVPFVEKAYAKIHGSYRSISGGQVEEAFLVSRCVLFSNRPSHLTYAT